MALRAEGSVTDQVRDFIDNTFLGALIMLVIVIVLAVLARWIWRRFVRRTTATFTQSAVTRYFVHRQGVTTRPRHGDRPVPGTSRCSQRDVDVRRHLRDRRGGFALRPERARCQHRSTAGQRRYRRYRHRFRRPDDRPRLPVRRLHDSGEPVRRRRCRDGQRHHWNGRGRRTAHHHGARLRRDDLVRRQRIGDRAGQSEPRLVGRRSSTSRWHTAPTSSGPSRF